MSQLRQVYEFSNIRLLGSQLCQTSLLLNFVRIWLGREEAVGAQVLPYWLWNCGIEMCYGVRMVGNMSCVLLLLFWMMGHDTAVGGSRRRHVVLSSCGTHWGAIGLGFS